MDKINPLTSLNQKEFSLLLSKFSVLVEQKICYFTLRGLRRVHPCFLEPKNSSLRGSEIKLEFILEFLKENPTQSFFAKMYKMTQSKISEWITFLLPVLEESLSLLKMLPKTGDTYDHLSFDDCLLIDVVENEVPRKTDLDNQREEYSGKKKKHTMKYLAIGNEKRFIYYLSPAYFGAKHDKSIFDDLSLQMDNSNLFFDLGFQGVQNDYENAILPYKRTKKIKLNAMQKESNKAISTIRIKIEHAFSGVKRFRIIHEKIRIKFFQKREEIMKIAVGIHNLRCTQRKTILNHL